MKPAKTPVSRHLLSNVWGLAFHQIIRNIIEPHWLMQGRHLHGVYRIPLWLSILDPHKPKSFVEYILTWEQETFLEKKGHSLYVCLNAI